LSQADPVADLRVCVLGLGYIGLPTAAVLATSGCRVVGVDTNPAVIRILSEGSLHIEEPDLHVLVDDARDSGRLELATRPEEADVFILCVQTPLTKERQADLSYLESATRSIVPYLRAGNLVVLESTVPPLTTANVIVPILEESGLPVDREGSSEVGELFVVHCPERVIPGHVIQEIVSNARVLGGLSRKAAEQAQELYSIFVEGDLLITDATCAEVVKLAENTHRDVNIALANEMARICEAVNVDVWEVLRLANRHPRVSFLSPGPGVGGHCISIDPWFLVQAAGDVARLIRTARNINDDQPEVVLSVIREMTSGVTNPKVALLGLAYKGNVDDTRESPALRLISRLRADGFELALVDPHVAQFDPEVVTPASAFEEADLAVVLAAHNEFRTLDPHGLGAKMRHRGLLDTRNCLPVDLWESAGFTVRRLGDGSHRG